MSIIQFARMIWARRLIILAAALFTFLVSMLARSGGLPMGFPLGWVVAVGVLLMAISLASGLMALGILKKSQPADLLR